MAAELVGGACLSAFLQVAIDRLASQEVVDYLRCKKLSDDLINNLKIALLAVNAVLNDAEEKQISSPYVKQWLDELEDASYVADDLLDEISTHALQSKLEAGLWKSMTSKVSNTFSISSRSYIRNMKNKLKEILRRLKTLEERIYVLGLNKGVGEKTWSVPPTTSLIEESEVCCRDRDKEAIIKLLLEYDDEGSNSVSVIPIVGMGGIGKTTLAQSVYNHHTVVEHFKLKFWVCVSEEFDICKVTKIILSSVTRSPFDSHDSTDLDSLQTALKEQLVGKKFLIVLDDVWNQNYVDWENLKKPFEYGDQGSKILVTTRNEDVARIMHTVPPYSLEHLSNKDCWQLFAKHAFHNTDYNAYPVLVNIGRKIVKKCKGLPLAAKTLGGLLRSTVDVAKWEKILENEIWELPYDESNILPALMLSYHHLPSHIKRCFAFCSIFPKDYIFQRNQLVSYWMAENLLQQTRRNRRAEDVGAEYFNKLVSMSFFQRSGGDIYLFKLFETSSGSRESLFVMHDLVHDLAKFVSRGYSFTFENGNSNENVEKVRHLGVASDVSLESFGSISKAVHLRSFLPSDIYSSFELWDFVEFSLFNNLSNEAVNNVIEKFRFLRILCLPFCKKLKQLSESIGELKYLRFLELSRSSIKRLPNSVSKLYNLQALKLSRCLELTELPEDMHHLINLRHLDISYCSKLEKMSRQIGELKHLCVLDLSCTSIKRLPNSVSKLYNLQTLKLYGCYFLTELPEDMYHLINWRHLDISGCYKLEKMPRQIGELKSLQTLSTFIVGKDDGAMIEELRELSGLHGEISLKNLGNVKSATDASEARLMDKKHITMLDLSWNGEAGENEREVAEKLLPHTNLERLCITGYGGPSFPSWLGDVSFCNIVYIKLKDCRKCSSLPPLGQLPSLKSLDIDGLHEVVSVGAEFLYGIGGSSVRKPFASLVSLSFRCMPNWVKWCLKIGVENGEAFPRLQVLHIEDCDRLSRVDWPDSLPCLTTLLINALGYEVIESISVPNTPVLCELMIGRYSLHVDGLPSTVGSLKKVCVTSGWDSSITFLSERQWLTTITEIQIVFCYSLAFFPLDWFPSLRNLYVSDCQSLECVGVSSSANGDGLQCLTSLSSIQIVSCKKLRKVLPEKIQNLLPSLATLYIYCCPELESICPGVGLPSNLKSISIRDCPKLSAKQMAWNLQTLQVLESFIISDEQGGGGVESFPEEGMLPSSLYSLEIYRLPHLKRLDIKGLQQLTSLHTLHIVDCPQLEKLPQQGLPISLTRLHIGNAHSSHKGAKRRLGKIGTSFLTFPKFKSFNAYVENLGPLFAEIG